MVAKRRIVQSMRKAILWETKNNTLRLCDLCFSVLCAEISDNDHVFFTHNGKISCIYVASTKLLRSNRNYETPIKPKRFLSATYTAKNFISPERQLNLPQLKAISPSVIRLKQRRSIRRVLLIYLETPDYGQLNRRVYPN
jgi:hypothetical protein